MENLKKLVDSQILSANFNSDLSELHLVIEDDYNVEKIIEFREIIYSEYSRSYADGGPGFYIFEIFYDDDQNIILDYLKEKYGFKGSDELSSKGSNLKFKRFRLEGDVCINVVCEDIIIYSKLD